jgi:hypothetical protein
VNKLEIAAGWRCDMVWLFVTGLDQFQAQKGALALPEAAIERM